MATPEFRFWILYESCYCTVGGGVHNTNCHIKNKDLQQAK